jgi:hypothetical protein
MVEEDFFASSSRAQGVGYSWSYNNKKKNRKSISGFLKEAGGGNSSL